MFSSGHQGHVWIIKTGKNYTHRNAVRKYDEAFLSKHDQDHIDYGIVLLIRSIYRS